MRIALSAALVESMRSLGVEAEYERPVLTGHRAGGKKIEVKPCFTSTSRFEVSAGGRKIVGSAQKLIGDHLLQHGSLPLVEPPAGPHEFVPHLSGSERKRLGEELSRRSVTLSEALGRVADYREVRDALFAGFLSVFAVRIAPGPLSDGERVRCGELVEKKYATSEWNESTTADRFEGGSCS